MNDLATLKCFKMYFTEYEIIYINEVALRHLAFSE